MGWAVRYEYREGYACKHRLVFPPIELVEGNNRVFMRPKHFDANYQLRPEVELWLNENVEPHEQWRRGYFVCEDLRSMLVNFVRKADAMRFKLVWS